MSLASRIKASVGTLDADIEKVFTAAEPELQALARSEAVTMLKGLLAELPSLTAVITPALTAAGLPVTTSAELVSASASWLATAIQKVSTAPAVAPPGTTTVPTPPAVPATPVKTTP